MSRTESKSIQVHPNNEQQQIDLMQKFHWSLINSQEIKNIDNHLERRGDDLYQVKKSEHYVKLTFSRSLGLPNLDKIRQLENNFFALRAPRLFPLGVWLWIILALFYGIGIILWLLHYFTNYRPKNEEFQSQSNALLNEVSQYD